MKLKKNNKVDRVVMFDCMEAKHLTNYGKVWDMKAIHFEEIANSQKGGSGSFHCRLLQIIK